MHLPVCSRRASFIPFAARNIIGSRRIIVVGVGLFLACLVGLTGNFYRNPQPPNIVPETQCAQSSETVEPSVAWRFRTDPDDVGLTGRWFDPAFDDGNWQANAPGEAWYPEYVGVAWYRATFTPPAEWGSAYLGIGQVDDTAQLWVNGVQLDWDPATGEASQVVQVAAGQPLQVSFRVVNLGGPGGIKQPVQVGRNPRSVLPPDSYARWLAATHPDWPMPGWARNGYYAWTFTGLPGHESRALIGSDGAVAPWPTAASVSLWMYDPASGKLSTPRPAFSLLDGSLPIPQTEWIEAGLTVRTTLFRTANGEATRWQATLSNQTNETRSGTLLAVVRPFAFNPGLRPTFAAGFDSLGRLWLGGQPFMDTSPKAAHSGVGELPDVLAAARTGVVPQSQNLPCAPAGDAAAASAYPVRLQPGESFKLSLGFPSERGAPFPSSEADGGVEDTRRIWQTAVGAESVVVPDQTIMNAYRASLGYLLLALSPKGPRPGPLEHAKVWVRDAAFIGEALLSAGQIARVEEYLPKLFEHQATDGRIPAIIGPNGPEQVDEWDAQGQAIFLVGDIYQYHKDLSFLQKWEPRVKLAAEFLRSLREQTKADPPATRGLLPPSRSAEDLGPEDWHHYWDDFWAVAGLDEAAFIESELGHPEDANWMRAEAQELRQAIRASVDSVMGTNPDYIPGAPEDMTSSAMARGTSVSLYPDEVFPWDDPLIVRSFEAYYAKWIAPNGGGYSHLWGQWWPYGGLGLARDYLRLGRPDIVHQILGWTLSHQTLPGTYAWAEQVNPTDGAISGGDMPHAWAAASYVTLIREMLAVRHGDELELFSGVPASWLDKGKVVGVKSAPTEFGSLTALIESNLDTSGPAWKGTLTLTIEGSAQPAGGFSWKLPQSPQWIEGPPGAGIRDGRLTVPGSGGVVRLGYSAPN